MTESNESIVKDKQQSSLSRHLLKEKQSCSTHVCLFRQKIMIISTLFLSFMFLSISLHSVLSSSSMSSSMSSSSRSKALHPSDYGLSIATRRKFSIVKKEQEEEIEKVDEESDESRREGAYFREYVYRSPASVTTKKPATTSKIRSKFTTKGSEFHEEGDNEEGKRNRFSSTDPASDVLPSFPNEGGRGGRSSKYEGKGRKKKRMMHGSAKKSVFNVSIPPSTFSPSSSYDEVNDGDSYAQDKRSSSSITSSSDQMCPCLRGAERKSRKKADHDEDRKKKFHHSSESAFNFDSRYNHPISSSSYKKEKSSRKEPVYYSVYEVFDDDVPIHASPLRQSSFHAGGHDEQESNGEGFEYSGDVGEVKRKRKKSKEPGVWEKDERNIPVVELPRWRPSEQTKTPILPEWQPTKGKRRGLKVSSIQDILADVQKNF